MGQTEKKWEVRTIFRGMHWQILRTSILLLPVFTTFDYIRTKTTLFNSIHGYFYVTFGVVGLSYIWSWPLETLKNLSQAGLPHPHATVSQRINYMGGGAGLMRGVLPGAFGGGLRNAVGMVAMIYAHRLVTMVGLRDV